MALATAPGLGYQERLPPAGTCGTTRYRPATSRGSGSGPRPARRSPPRPPAGRSPPRCRRASALFQRDSDPGAVHEHERGVELGAGGNGLDVLRIRLGPPHVMGDDQPAGADVREELLQVRVVALL